MPDENMNTDNTTANTNADDPVLEQLANMLSDSDASQTQPTAPAQPYAEQPYEEQAYEEQAYEGQAVADQEYAEQAYAEQASVDQAYTDQTYADQDYAAQPYTDQPYTAQPPTAQTQYAQPVPPQYGQTGTNPGTTPMVLGILSIVFAGLVGLVLSILAITKSRNVIKTYGENSRAKAGKVTGIIGLVLSILAMFFALAVVAGATYFAMNYDGEELASYIEDALVEEGYISSDNASSATSGSTGATAGTPSDTDTNASLSDTVEGGSSPSDAAATGGAYTPDTEEEAAAIEAVNKSFEDLKDPRSSIRAEIAQEMEDIFDDGETGLKDLGITGDEFAGWILDDIRYTAQDATLFDTGDGWVDVIVESRDFNSFYDKLDELVFAFNDEGGFKDMSPEDVNAKMGEFFRSAMEQTDKAEKTVMFDVKKNGDAWEVDEDSLWFALDSILFGY